MFKKIIICICFLIIMSHSLISAIDFSLDDKFIDKQVNNIISGDDENAQKYFSIKSNWLFIQFELGEKKTLRDETINLLKMLDEKKLLSNNLKCLYFFLFQLGCQIDYFAFMKYQDAAVKYKEYLESNDAELGRFSSALYYFSTPGFFGGNDKKAEEILLGLSGEYNKEIYKYYYAKVLLDLKKKSDAEKKLQEIISNNKNAALAVFLLNKIEKK